MMDPKAYWVGFNLIKGIGSVKTRLLLDKFETLENAWKASSQQLISIGLSERIVESFVSKRKQVDPEEIWEKIAEKGIEVLTWEDSNYPKKLFEVDQPPPVLYYKGKIKSEDDWAIAIVGTRRMTVYGRQVTQDLATVLASKGVTVVSGLARGIDAIAHTAAMDAGGRTFAVLGCGADIVYPPENRKIYERIIESGALISEYPLGTMPESTNFPPRNRIISGLSHATVVVEAGETSGALITASFAANQGREVFAVPGNILAPQSMGCNRLIRDGARILLNPNDVLETLNLSAVGEYKQARLLIPGNEVESTMLKILDNESLHIDEIQARSGLPIEKVSATLVMMELKGMVKQMDGMTYMVLHEGTGYYQAN
jgi:DNA processing protein